eukprot:scaffold672665_cov33-Prasinocladus_malaysianus.AAC.1
MPSGVDRPAGSWLEGDGAQSVLRTCRTHCQVSIPQPAYTARQWPCCVLLIGLPARHQPELSFGMCAPTAATGGFKGIPLPPGQVQLVQQSLAFFSTVGCSLAGAVKLSIQPLDHARQFLDSLL